MIPFRLFLKPGTIFDKYPRRDWRRVSLWLKWGLLFSLLGVFTRILLATDPVELSSIMAFLEFIAEEGEADIPRLVNFSLFAIVQTTYLVLLWIFRGLILYAGIKVAGESFVEFSVALSISAAGMVTGLWYLLPYGYLLYFAHGVFLISFLLMRINRLESYTAIITAVIAVMLPLIF